MHDARRRFIRVIGSASVIAAAPQALGACAPMPDEAIEAWRRAGQEQDPRRKLLSWAILAPNPHNLQPWLVDLRSADRIMLYCDLERLLPMTDPPSRQIVIGHGCFLELLALAAAANGLRAGITPFPEGEPGAAALDARPVARIDLAPAPVARDPLFDQVLARGTYRKPFSERKVPREALEALVDAAARPAVRVSATQEPAMVAHLNRIMVQAWELEQRTPRVWKESVDVMRVGSSEIARHRDGIALGGTMIEIIRLLGMTTPQTMMDPSSVFFSQGLNRVYDWAPNTGAYAWLTTSATGRGAQLEAGRAFVRLQLKAAELGIVTQPPSQVLQEFAEMDALRAQFEQLVAQPAGEKTQMLVRIGYPDASEARSARRPLESFVRT
ncbi:MAG: nitroreductase family protein [Burkholderiaceae bacterium]|nr:nitroreductase family protein [Burkholderiaceae bacterium]